MLEVSTTVLRSTGQEIVILGAIAPNPKAKGYFSKPQTNGYVDIGIPYLNRQGDKKLAFQRVRQNKLETRKIS